MRRTAGDTTWHQQQSENWKNGCQQVAARIERSREWHQGQSKGWQQECARLEARIGDLTTEIQDTAAAREWHQQQSESWQEESAHVAARIAHLTTELQDTVQRAIGSSSREPVSRRNVKTTLRALPR